MKSNEPNKEEPKCSICGKPLYGEEWFDDEQYGDAHTRCIEAKGDSWGERPQD